MKPKDLVGIPWALAFALRADGWWLRSDNVWFKRNPMPSSVNGWRWEKHRVKIGNRGRATEGYKKVGNQQDHDEDGNFLSDAIWEDCPGCDVCIPNDGLILIKGSWRTTTSHEYIFMLAKDDDYYCDREAVMEDGVTPEDSKAGHTFGGIKNDTPYKAKSNQPGKKWEWNQKHNLRSVWDITTKPYSQAHFAVFPSDIPTTCIKASTSERGECPSCGAPWVRVVKKAFNAHDGQTESQYEKGTTAKRLAQLRQAARENGEEYANASETVGWKATCKCNKEPIPQTVLDPFAGSGTTLEVAERLGRNSIGIELSEKYVKDLIEPRMRNVNPLFQ